MLKAMLIDDEVLALSLLEAMLTEVGGVEVLGAFTDPIEGLRQVKLLEPDVLFLDIEMAQLTGLKLAESVNIHTTDIVFVTAYDHYALEAFSVQALDYILKPIDKMRLQRAVERLRNRKFGEMQQPKKHSMVQVRLLGSFELIGTEQQPIKWRTKKVKELCAFLIHHGQAVHRDAVIEALWPDTPVEKASTLLHTTIYQLRKAFKEADIEHPIRFTDERYKLAVEMEIDAELLVQYMEAGEIEALLELSHQDYLAKEDYPWATARRETLQKQITQVLEKFIQSAAEPVKREPVFKKALGRLIAFYPWEERYVLELLKCLVEEGKQNEAFDTIEIFQRDLASELGMVPSEEFEEAVGRLLTGG
ncbi:hypothetical protein NCCP2222_33050 [Sporosarcina sp. NCCP-2222]|uniref:response regulator n=1 Tax=Sporosarcina sp. NCCP-2222 TaxID=2935073 RepID=UPI002089CA54|nr:response regulator [Sporosarcina sp. NCCP-2222]GKV57358.1 hypothetical protein NCCP2222_33050 [Sporosarcina sp. NCCP-2222]